MPWPRYSEEAAGKQHHLDDDDVMGNSSQRRVRTAVDRSCRQFRIHQSGTRSRNRGLKRRSLCDCDLLQCSDEAGSNSSQSLYLNCFHPSRTRLLLPNYRTPLYAIFPAPGDANFLSLLPLLSSTRHLNFDLPLINLQHQSSHDGGQNKHSFAVPVLALLFRIYPVLSNSLFIPTHSLELQRNGATGSR